MKKKLIVILTLIFLLILGGAVFFYFSFFQQDITGAVITNYHNSFTKAICNESNYCQDYEIVCENNITISQNPITGAAVQHTKDWQDPRTQEEIEKMCG